MDPAPLSSLRRQAEAAFSVSWPAPLAVRLSRDLLAWLLGASPAWIASNGDAPVPGKTLRRLRPLLVRAAAGEPLARLTGETSFHGRIFTLSRHVLIPRTETEALVDLALERWPKEKPGVCAVDVGCGSGCIGLTLALERGSDTVLLSDTSRRALDVARKNAERLFVDKKTRPAFLQGSLFSRTLEQAVLARKPRTLLVVANLPYVPDDERETLSRSVTGHEPAAALFGGKVGDELIRRTLKQLDRFARRHPDVRLEAFFELDPSYATTLLAWTQALFPNQKAALHEDGFGRVRYLALTAPGQAPQTPGRRS